MGSFLTSWVGSRRNAAAHCRRNLGGAAALGSPYGGAGEPAASLRGRRQLQIRKSAEIAAYVPSQSRQLPVIEPGDTQRCWSSARVTVSNCQRVLSRPLSHGYAVPALPKGEPRGGRCPPSAAKFPGGISCIFPACAGGDLHRRMLWGFSY